MTFGEKIKEIRKSKRMTLKKLSSISDVAVPTIWNAEHGKSIPNAVNISKLAKALDYSYEELYDLAESERN